MIIYSEKAKNYDYSICIINHNEDIMPDIVKRAERVKHKNKFISSAVDPANNILGVLAAIGFAKGGLGLICCIFEWMDSRVDPNRLFNVSKLYSSLAITVISFILICVFCIFSERIVNFFMKIIGEKEYNLDFYSQSEEQYVKNMSSYLKSAKIDDNIQDKMILFEGSMDLDNRYYIQKVRANELTIAILESLLD